MSATMRTSWYAKLPKMVDVAIVGTAAVTVTGLAYVASKVMREWLRKRRVRNASRLPQQFHIAREADPSNPMQGTGKPAWGLVSHAQIDVDIDGITTLALDILGNPYHPEIVALVGGDPHSCFAPHPTIHRVTTRWHCLPPEENNTTAPATATAPSTAAAPNDDDDNKMPVAPTQTRSPITIESLHTLRGLFGASRR